MMRIVIVGIFVLFLALAVVCKPAPTTDAIETCARVGQSTGCSGCNSNTVDCEWCVSPTNDADGKCVPDGFCSMFKNADNQPLVTGKQLCPADVKKEPRYSGAKVATGDHTGRKIEGVFSPHFDSHYCEFPTQPWPIDRSANPFFNNDPTGNCYRVNNILSTGQRRDLGKCLAEVPSKTRDVSDKQEIEIQASGDWTLKRLECLKLYNSYACTVSCPKYGAGMDFTQVCSDYCERLFQHCDEHLLYCMASIGLDLSEYFGCAEPDAVRCSRPELIPTSGRFEYDMCFFGDASRCKTGDCRVELATGEMWPAYFSDEEEWSGSNGESFESDQMGPACDYHDDWYDGEHCCDGHAGLLYRVVEVPVEGGMSCETATILQALKDWGSQVYEIQGAACTPGSEETLGGRCALALSLESGERPLPEGLNDDTYVYNCPAVIEDLGND